MDQVEEIKQKTDIVSLVGERVKLVRAGRNFKALCPFHSERTPSFMVSPELQIFKCFGCGKAGDVYSFLEEFDGMEFPDALNYLAKRAGVKLEPFRKDKDYQKKERLREINHLASEYFHYLLTSHKVGERARRYLGERGIRKPAIETFKLGFASESWDGLIRYLVGKKRYKLEELLEVGLVVKGRKGDYDRFRNRTIFPLRDVRGNVLGFAGRIMPGGDEERAKYINSPETVLYHKSDHLYGLHENRATIKKKDQVVVVEGEFDAISSWQAGLKQVVAVKGTALTEGQIKLLRRYTRNVALALDADTAGDAATKRGIALADAALLNIKVTLLSGGKDPDQIAQDNPKKWRQLVEKATSVYDFYIKSARRRFDVASGLGKKRISEELMPVLSKITNAVEQAHYIKKLAQLLDVSSEAVVDEVNRFQRMAAVDFKPSTGTAKASLIAEEEKKDRREVLEEYLLSLVLQGGMRAVSSLGEFEASDIAHRAARRIMERILKVDKNEFKAGSFIAALPAELKPLAEAAFLRDLSDMASDPEALASEIERVVSELRQFRLKEQLVKLSSEIRVLEERRKLTEGQENELGKLKQKFSELSRQLSH
jgi:DNA primase